jgi:outer membrane protein
MKRLLVAVVALLPAWAAASAQENRDIRVRLGPGVQFRPVFVGSGRVEAVPWYSLDVARGTDEFKAKTPYRGAGLGLISTGRFSFGPVGNIQAARKESKVGAPVGRVPTTIEAGAFAQYDPSDSFRFRAQLLRGIGGHKGLIGAIGADRIWRDGDNYVFSLGPRIIFSDARFQRAYFGVTPAASLASGLPTYRVHGGIQGVALASGMSYQLNKRWGLFGFARWERLVGQAARSPIVRQLGSRNQLSGGVGLNYTFTIHRPPKAQ